MHLRFGRTRTDRAPAHQITDVLWRLDIEKFDAGWHARSIDLDQQFARQPQTAIDVIAAIELRVVDQPLPADGGAWLFEINPHHDFQIGRQLPAQGQQASRVLLGRVRIMNRAGAHHDQQPVIGRVKNAMDRLARAKHHVSHQPRGWRFRDDLGRGR